MNFHVYYFDWDWNARTEIFESEHDAFEFMRVSSDCMFIYHIAKECVE